MRIAVESLLDSFRAVVEHPTPDDGRTGWLFCQIAAASLVSTSAQRKLRISSQIQLLSI